MVDKDEDAKTSRNPFDEPSQKLRESDPNEIAGRTHVAMEEGVFGIPFLAWDIQLTHPDLAFTMPPWLNTFSIKLLTLIYLTTGSDAPNADEWAPYRALKGGLFYAKNFTETVENRIVDRFGNDLEAFQQAALALGGRRVEQADMAFVFQVFPTVPIMVLLWRASEEFAASGMILFDMNATEHLSVFDLKMLSAEVVSLLVKVADGRVELER